MDKESLRLNGEEKNKGFIIEVLTQAKKMQLKDWKCMVFIVISFIPGKIWKCLYRHLWVVSEYENLARDNGYWFFKYIRENYPKKKVYYPINSNASDAKKIKYLGNMIKFGSFKHYMLFWGAEKQFTSSKNAGFPSRICEDLVQWNFHSFQYVLLNHGITKGKSTVVDASKTNYDFICTCSNLDRQIIINDNGQPSNKVLLTGFARHDNLNDKLLNKNLILIMPTWRTWINYKQVQNTLEKEEMVQAFLKSDYYKKYYELLREPRLTDYLKDNNLSLIFYLHDYAQYYSEYYTVENTRITIARSEQFDIQTLLKQAAILITDYSSVCYDFAYMKKPVLYYQFDKEQFEFFQYKAGNNYTYEDNGVGELCYELDVLIDTLIKYHKTGFRMPTIYKERVDKYFAYHDCKNCKRIYSYIVNKKKMT